MTTKVKSPNSSIIRILKLHETNYELFNSETIFFLVKQREEKNNDIAFIVDIRETIK